MKNDPLPTPKQREMLCEMIADALVELRHLGWSGHAAQASDLADAFHNIPKEMYGWGTFSWNGFRGMLEAYQFKWRDKETVPAARDYVKMLDEIRAAGLQGWMGPEADDGN
jgi:hypothetical protein